MSKGNQSSNRASDLPGPTHFQIHPTHDEQLAMGRALRAKCSRKAHTGWQPPSDRADPLVLLQESSKGRMPQLIPIRYGRMLQSPFAWYRGSAMSMAADLSRASALP